MKKIEDYLHYYIGQKCLIIGEGDDKKFTIMGVERSLDYKDLLVSADDEEYHHEVFHQNIILILRPLSDMTEEDLTDIIKEVSLIDLSQCEFECGEEDNEKWVNAIHSGRVIDCLSFDNNVFHVMNNDGSMSHLNPQSQAFHYLLSRGFDLFGLIESGLAIDSKTIK